MPRSIVIVQGHPDGGGAHLCHALADAYRQGAEAAGHDVSVIDVGAMELPFIRTQAEWRTPSTDAAIMASQAAFRRADHLVIIYPLWLGDVPAKLKAFFEQISRGGFAIDLDDKGHWRQHLTGKSARVVVTMGMPAIAYRWFFFSHSLKSLERNFLKFAGISPIRETLLGQVEGDARAPARARWIDDLRLLGRAAA
jgi:putative NADPH-quinone reductase